MTPGTNISALETNGHTTELCGTASNPHIRQGGFEHCKAQKKGRREHEYHLSCNKLKGYLKPGGNSGFSSSGMEGTDGLVGFEEFPAFPDLTMPFLGGIANVEHQTPPTDQNFIVLT